MRTHPPVDATETETLLGFLDHQRDTLMLKVDGLGDDQLRQRIAPSQMTLGGLLSHMAYVEDWWCGHVYAEQPPAPPWDTAPWDDDNDWDWHRAESQSAEDLIGFYSDFVHRSRALLSGDLNLDEKLQPLTKDPGRQITLRWMLMHLITEYARHCGHADLLRETIDGTTGE